MKDLNQNSGDNSTNIQGQTVNIAGVSATEARQIALDVYNANFMTLSGAAREIAKERAEQITEKFLEKLQDKNPIGLDQAKDPDFQHALYTLQKEYARNGDRDLGTLLVDILVDRSKHPDRDIIQIVLNECLLIAPKLTGNQLAALGLIFLFKYTVNYTVNSRQSYFGYLDLYVKKYSELIDNRNATYQHLEYSGCANIGLGAIDISIVLRNNYGGIFSKGFDIDRIAAHQISIPFSNKIFTHCLNDEKKWQINSINEATIKTESEKLAIPDADVPKLIALYNESIMSFDEIKAFTIKGAPYMENIFGVWSSSAMKNISLTSVGIAIGYANIKKDLGDFADLSIWIN